MLKDEMNNLYGNKNRPGLESASVEELEKIFLLKQDDILKRKRTHENKWPSLVDYYINRRRYGN